jgi:hypothetical protein
MKERIRIRVRIKFRIRVKMEVRIRIRVMTYLNSTDPYLNPYPNSCPDRNSNP